MNDAERWIDEHLERLREETADWPVWMKTAEACEATEESRHYPKEARRYEKSLPSIVGRLF